MPSDRRTNPFTDVALQAIDEIDALVNELVAELAIPLGTRIVPESTRRGRQARTAEELADLFVSLSQQFGADQVADVLGLPPLEAEGDTRPMVQVLVDAYGEEVVTRAIRLLHLRLQALAGTPPDEVYLPPVTDAA